MNIKYPFLIFLLLYANFCFSGEYDYERMYSESNVALGIPPEARGNRFELLKASKTNPNNGASTLFGITGSAVGGLNPFSSSSFSVVTGLSALHSLLKPSKDKPTRKTYKGFEQTNKFFSGLKLNQDDADYIRSANVDIITKFKDSLLLIEEPDSKIIQDPTTLEKTDSKGNANSIKTYFHYDTPDGFHYDFIVDLKKIESEKKDNTTDGTKRSKTYNAKLSILLFHKPQTQTSPAGFLNADMPAFAKIIPVLESFNEKIGTIIFSDDLRTIVFEGNIYTDHSL